MTFARGAASNGSPRPVPAVRPAKLNSLDRGIMLVLIVGILMGMVLAAVLGIGLYAFGWLNFGVAAPNPASPAICVPTPAFLPLCPTCDAAALLLAGTGTATPSPAEIVATATATPDYAATATQVCYYWSFRFPGTPCPPFVTPSP